MFSFRTVLFLFLFALIAIVGSTNGEPGYGSSPSWDELHDEQARASEEAGDRFNRITLSCETAGGGGSGGNSGSVMIIELSVGLFFLIWVAIGIWFFCVRRQKVMNAPAIKPYPGEVGAKEMGDKTKTVASSATTGKLSNGDTNV